MTSEICVMNRHSFVLASDSAATVSQWEDGKKEERYFKGSNKIFQLSNTEPVGIMIYDSADLQRIPWEIIVKTFGSQLASTSFRWLREYGLHFLSFIECHRGSFPAAYLDELLIENVDQIMIRSATHHFAQSQAARWVTPAATHPYDAGKGALMVYKAPVTGRARQDGSSFNCQGSE